MYESKTPTLLELPGLKDIINLKLAVWRDPDVRHRRKIDTLDKS